MQGAGIVEEDAAGGQTELPEAALLSNPFLDWGVCLKVQLMRADPEARGAVLRVYCVDKPQRLAPLQPFDGPSLPQAVPV